MAKTPVRSTAPPQHSDEPFQEIVLPRETGTHGDILAALGLAEVLSEVATDQKVTIKNRGANFAVCLSRPRRPSDLQGAVQTPGYQYLQSKSTVAAPAGVSNPLDYQTTRDRIAELRRQESELHTAVSQAKTDEAKQHLRDQIKHLRDSEWPIPADKWRRIAPYLMLQGHETANKLLTTLLELSPDEFRALVQGGLSALVAGRPSGVDWNVSTVQLFSPNAAKGYARLKPDSTGRGDKTKDAWADPFVEWLRYRGYFIATMPAFHGGKGEHIRILAPVPEDISVRAYVQLVSQLPTPMRGASPPKIDILTTLTIAQLLVEHSEVLQNAATDDEDDDLIVPSGSTPSQVISGLAVTNYQSLGSARAVSLMTELAVPGWFPISTAQDATDWLAILDEHREIVRRLADDHSDELTLLLGYRRFLEQRGTNASNEGALDAYLDFAGAYGGFVLRAREAGRLVRQFSTNLFEKVVESMSTDYSAILADAGFKAVAAAIRRATVSAQSLKARNTEHREIRYGLLSDLRRATQLSDSKALLIGVAEFVDLYNAENARREESTKRPWHARVTTDELVAFTQLVDHFDAGVVGALLCAYGTCREPREPGGGEPVVAANEGSVTEADVPDGEDVDGESEE